MNDPRLRIISYLPLILLGLEVAWLLILFFGFLFLVGDTPYKNTEGKTRFADLLAMIPLVIGLLSGVFAVVIRAPKHPVDWVFLVIGWILCALAIFPFVFEFLN